MSASRFLGAGASLALHAALAFAILWPGTPPAFDVPVAQSDESGEPEMRLIPTPDKDGSGMACDGSYRGIGAVATYSGYIEEVVSGGPADHAGMQIGDRFLNAEMFSRDLYSIGRDLVLKVDRHGVRLDLPVRIGRVCYERLP